MSSNEPVTSTSITICAAANSTTSSYRTYVLSLLFLANAFNMGDRMVIGIVQEPLRAEFHLSDLQLGFLGGTAYAVLYTFIGLPIARLADRYNRATILSAAIGLWSFMTASCGLGASYIQLLFGRAGVSIGEAGCAPTAHSLISDYFPPTRRATALSIYVVGAPVGTMTVAFLGGVFTQQYGWRATFWVLGAGGLLLAIVTKLTLREPVRTRPATEAATFWVAFRTLWGKLSFRHVAFSGAVSGLATYALVQYMGSFLIRDHGLSLADAAKVIGATTACGAIGAYVSGYLIDRLAPRRSSLRTQIPALGLSIAAFFFIAAFLVQPIALVVPLLMLALMFQNSFMGQSFAVAQGVAPPRMRATSSAIFIFAHSLIGFGLGPLTLGLVSDRLAKLALDHSTSNATVCLATTIDIGCANARAVGLRRALVIWSLLLVWAGAHFWLAGRTLARDMEA